ncbi:hypothetical protein [Bacillus sp. FJAT-45350]|uniref:hypothetical protein n=1 Tax=Bacillus sp. FJAT-45350 TaxID=2011014 RepID=UPI000BB720AF|nr:hypothetical protein [Bacillus sp. FJAT-45350]
MQQQQNVTQQQGIMPQPPNVVTSKDHLYISDMLSWNLLAMKKCNFFAQQCMDPEVKNAIQKAGQMHERHYQKLLGHLQSQNQPSQMQQQQLQ